MWLFSQDAGSMLNLAVMHASIMGCWADFDASLVIDGFDELAGPIREDYWAEFCIGTDCDVNAVYTTSSFVQGEGALRLDYDVKHSVAWGGFVQLTHRVEDSGVYNLEGCSKLSFWYNNVKAASLPGRGEFRLLLIDSRDCAESCEFLLDKDSANNMEYYYSFHKILDEEPGWHKITLELEGDDTYTKPFVLTEWNGVSGNKLLDKSSIKAFILQLVVDGQGEADIASLNGTLLLDALECSGPQLLESQFWHRFEAAIGHWQALNSTVQSCSEISGSDEMEQHPSSGKWLNDTWCVENGTFQVGQFLPSNSFYNLSDAPENTSWFQGNSESPPPTSFTLFGPHTWQALPGFTLPAHSIVENFSVKDYVGSNISGGEMVTSVVGHDASVSCRAASQHEISTILKKANKHGRRAVTVCDGLAYFHNVSDDDELELQLSEYNSTLYVLEQDILRYSNVAETALTPVAKLWQRALELKNDTGINRTSCYDGSLVRGLTLTIAAQPTGDLPAGSSPLLIGFGDLRASLEPYVVEEMMMNLWHEASVRTHDKVLKKEACAAICLEDPSCLFFAFRLPVAFQNCAVSPRVSRENVFPKDVFQNSFNTRSNLSLQVASNQVFAGWIIARRPFACADDGEEGVCSCHMTATFAKITCARPDTGILPYITPRWQEVLEELSLEGSSVTFLTEKLLGSLPQLRILNLGMVAFLDPQVIPNNPGLSKLNSAESLMNYLPPTDERRFGDVCCSRGPGVNISGMTLLPCAIEKYTPGIDCAHVDVIGNDQVDSWLQEGHESGWAIASDGECCDLCMNTPGCTHYIFDERLSTRSLCHLKNSALDPNPAAANSQIGVVSGYTPQTRFRDGDVSIKVKTLFNSNGTLKPASQANGTYFILGPVSAGQAGYVFEYQMEASGLVGRGSLWIKPIAWQEPAASCEHGSLKQDLHGIQVEPQQIQFGDAGDLSIISYFKVTVLPDMDNHHCEIHVFLNHEVEACDEAWNFLSNDSSHSISLKVLPNNCAAGQSLDTKSNVCVHCLPGTYSQGSILTCKPCPRGRYSDAGAKECFAFQELYFAGFATAVCLLTASFALFMYSLDRVIPIKEITTLADRVQVETLWVHHVRPVFGSRTVRVSLTDAGSLDGEYSVEVFSPDELNLLDADGQPLQNKKVEASIAKIRLQGLQRFHSGGLCLGLPPWVAMIGFLSMAAVVISIPETNLMTNFVGIGAEFVVSSIFMFSLTLAFMVVTYIKRRHKIMQMPPILRKVKLFRNECDRRGWHSKRCKRGPHRSVTAEKLVLVRDVFFEFLRNRDMYFVASSIVEPLTKTDRTSFSESVGPTDIQWFVSHYWGSSFKDFAATIETHAKEFSNTLTRKDSQWSNTDELVVGRRTTRSSKSTVKTVKTVKSTNAVPWCQVSYWICTFSVNQWNVDEEVRHWEETSFYLALTSEACQGTMMVLDIDVLPLTRSWCLFELLQTFARKKRLQTLDSKSDFLFQLGTASGVLNHSATMNVAITVQIARAVAGLSLANAQASKLQDKDMIDRLVVDMGGFDLMNKFIRKNVLDVLHGVKDQVVKDLDDLEALLQDDSEESEDMPQLAPCSLARNVSMLPGLTREQMSEVQLPQLLSQSSFEGSDDVMSEMRKDGTPIPSSQDSIIIMSEIV